MRLTSAKLRKQLTFPSSLFSVLIKTTTNETKVEQGLRSHRRNDKNYCGFGIYARCYSHRWHGRDKVNNVNTIVRNIFRNSPTTLNQYFSFFRIRVHRVVMAAASKHFQSLFGPEDNRRDEIVLQKIDGSTLKIIIDLHGSHCSNRSQCEQHSCGRHDHIRAIKTPTKMS